MILRDGRPKASLSALIRHEAQRRPLPLRAAPQNRRSGKAQSHKAGDTPFRISGFPRARPTLLLIIPAVLAFYGTFDTIRCLQPHRNLYHAGIVLCLLMDILAICLILFFLFFPYLF